MILACHQLGGEGIELAHHPLHLANLHQIAGPQGAGVDEHQAAHGMVHDARRPQGHHEAEEDADPLEGVGVGTGQIGVGHGQGKQPDHHREQPPGRSYGLGMQPLHAKLPPLDAIEENGQHTDEEAGDDDDQHHCHQARHGRNHALQHVAAQGKQGVSQPLAPGPGLGEETKHIGEPAIGEHEDQQQGQQAEQADLHVARYLAPLMGDQSLLQQEAIGEPLPDPSMTPLQRPDEAEEDQAGQERQAASLDQIGGGVQLEVLEPHLVEPLADTLARLIQRQLVEGFQIPLHQHQDPLAVDQELPAVLPEAPGAHQGHRLFKIGGLHLLEALLHQPDPARPVQSAKLGLEHDDGFMEQHQGLRLLLHGRLQPGFGGPCCRDLG